MAEIEPIIGLLFSTVKVIFPRNGLGNILGVFFTNASGHPVPEVAILPTTSIVPENEVLCPRVKSTCPFHTVLNISGFFIQSQKNFTPWHIISYVGTELHAHV
jgi:hypothetical protein